MMMPPVDDVMVQCLSWCRIRRVFWAGKFPTPPLEAIQEKQLTSRSDIMAVDGRMRRYRLRFSLLRASSGSELHLDGFATDVLESRVRFS